MNFQEKIIKSTAYKGYADHFQVIYVATTAFKAICLIVSCILSTRFFELSFEPYIGEYAIYGALLLSIFIALTVGYLTERLFSYYLEFRTLESWTVLLLAIFAIGGVICDFKGGEEIGADIVGSAPIDNTTNALTASYDKKIASLDSQIEEIKALNFYWCASHRKAHKCEKANFYIDPRRDKKAVEKIEKLDALKSETLATANTLTLESSSKHSKQVADHERDLQKSQNRMRYTSGIATIIFFVLSIWQMKFVERVKREAKEKGYTSPILSPVKRKSETPDPEPAPEPKASVDMLLETHKDELDKRFAEMLDQHNDLLDEKMAMIDYEKGKKNSRQ